MPLVASGDGSPFLRGGLRRPRTRTLQRQDAELRPGEQAHPEGVLPDQARAGIQDEVGPRVHQVPNEHAGGDADHHAKTRAAGFRAGAVAFGGPGVVTTACALHSGWLRQERESNGRSFSRTSPRRSVHSRSGFGTCWSTSAVYVSSVVHAQDPDGLLGIVDATQDPVITIPCSSRPGQFTAERLGAPIRIAGQAFIDVHHDGKCGAGGKSRHVPLSRSGPFDPVTHRTDWPSCARSSSLPIVLPAAMSDSASANDSRIPGRDSQ